MHCAKYKTKMALRQPIVEITKQFRNGSFSPVDLFEICLKNVKISKNVNAFILVNEEAARKNAIKSWKRYKNGETLGPFDGIPISIKDNFCIKDLPTTCASKMLKNFIPPYTASVVQHLLDQGALLMGKTNMDEFGMGTGAVDSIFGPVKNPWQSGLQYRFAQHSDDVKNLTECSVKDKDDFFISGGSSGGSAAAVATSSCLIALGSDTGGSTRNPAARCGVIGLKPTYGLLSRHGLIPLVNSMDVPGLMTKKVEDAALLLNELAGHDPKDSTTVHEPFEPFTLPKKPSVTGLNIGIPKEFNSVNLSAEMVSTWNFVADLFAKGGAKVSYISLPYTELSIACYSILNSCEVASNFARYDGIEFGFRDETGVSTEEMFAASRRKGFNEVVRGRILAGNYFLLKENYEKYFMKALKVRRLIADDYRKAFASGIDLMLTPVTLSESPSYKQFTLKDNREQVAIEDYCTQPINMAGIPAVSIPIKMSSNGLPLSLQLIASNFHEKLLLTTAKWLEEQVNFPSMELVEKKIV